MPVERDLGARFELDDPAIHVRARDAGIDDEPDPCPRESVGSRSPRRGRPMHRNRCGALSRSSAPRRLHVSQRTTGSRWYGPGQMQLTMPQAIKRAIADEMRADPRVVVFGEDVTEAGGVFKVTAGLLEEFGSDRVRDTPIAETAIIGAAIGAAAKGLRPVVEIMFAEFFGVALDQVVTEAAKMRYFSAGKIHLPIVLRASAGGGLGF